MKMWKALGVAVAALAACTVLSTSAVAGSAYSFGFGYRSGGCYRPYRYWGGYPRSYYSVSYFYAPPVYYAPSYSYYPPPVVVTAPAYYYSGGVMYRY